MFSKRLRRYVTLVAILLPSVVLGCAVSFVGHLKNIKENIIQMVGVFCNAVLSCMAPCVDYV